MVLETQHTNYSQGLAAGIDIGSTTTKVAVLEPDSGEVLYSDYRRHHADQVHSVLNVLDQLARAFPEQTFRVCLTGSGAKPIAEALDLPFAQEVAANAAALRRRYQKVGSAIELGGQDAKMIFSRPTRSPGHAP